MQIFKQVRIIILFFTVAITLYACNGSKRTTRNTVLLPTLNVGSSSSEFRASTPRIWDITETKAALSFNMKERTANGEAWIKLKPYMPYLPFVDSIVLDAKSMKIEQVKLLNANSTKTVKYNYKDDQIIIWLDGPAMDYEIYVKYTAMPYARSTGGSKAITDDRGLYFVNADQNIPNKPTQIWTQGETEATSHWLPTIDKPNERFKFSLSLTVPNYMTTLSNGLLVEQKQNGNLRTDRWEIDMSIQPYVAAFAIGEFEVVKDTWNGKEVSYYMEPEYAPYARGIFKNTPEMMTFFSDITGVPFPWSKYSQVVVRDFVSGAMENTTASIFGEHVNKNDRELMDSDNEDIVSHELFHHWFGDYVTAESWSNITMNESFANYAEQLWRNHKYGAANAQELAYKDLQIYLNSTKEGDPALLRHYYNNKEEVFDRISYNKGGATLHYLHGLMGDAAFYTAMNRYLTRNALSSAEVANWRLAVEYATGKDWNWFFSQWYNRGGHPELEIEHDYSDADKQLTVTIKQVQDDQVGIYRLPLYSLVVYGTDIDTVYWDITKQREAFTYSYRNGIRPLVISDIEHWLVGTIKEDKTDELWLQQYETADGQDLLTKLYAYQNILPIGKKNLKNTSDPDIIKKENAVAKLTLSDNLAYMRKQMLMYLSKRSSSALVDRWKDKVIFLARNDPDNNVRAVAIATLANWDVKDQYDFFKSQIDDRSYTVGGAALASVYKMDKDTGYAYAKKMLNTDPRGQLKSAIWVVLSAAAKDEDLKLFEDNIYNLTGGEKIVFAGSLTDYLQNVDNEDVFIDGLKLFKKILATENSKDYRSVIGLNLFGLAYITKDHMNKTASRDEKDKLERRLQFLKLTAIEVINNETEKENRETYETYFNHIFGSNNLDR